MFLSKPRRRVSFLDTLEPAAPRLCTAAFGCGDSDSVAPPLALAAPSASGAADAAWARQHDATPALSSAHLCACTAASFAATENTRTAKSCSSQSTTTFVRQGGGGGSWLQEGHPR